MAVHRRYWTLDAAQDDEDHRPKEEHVQGKAFSRSGKTRSNASLLVQLSQGEYIAPEKIEDSYSRSQFVSQVFVYGDSYKNYPVAIVVLNEDYTRKWLEKNGNGSTDIYDEKVRDVVMNDMLREGKKRDLMSYEQIKAIEFVKEPFSIENGLLTPTFKNRRYAIEKKYKDRFIYLYSTIDA